MSPRCITRRTALALAGACALGSLAFASAAPAATVDAELSVSARLQAGAAADVRQAARVAGRSQARAQRLVARADRRLRAAGAVAADLTARGSATSAQATASLSTAIRDQSTAAARLLDRTRGALRMRVARALRSWSELRYRIALGLAASASTGATATASASVALEASAREHVDVVSRLVAAVRGLRPGTKARDLLAHGVAAAISAQARLTAAVDDLRAHADTQSRAAAERAAAQVAASSARLGHEIEGSDAGSVSVSGSAGGSATLGQLAAQAGLTASAKVGG